MSRKLSIKAQNAAAAAKAAANAEHLRIEDAANVLAQTADRTTLIDRVLASCRRPVPEIVASRVWLASNGQYYNVFGFPLGVSAIEDAPPRILGYVYRGPDGCTYGTQHETPEAAAAIWTVGPDATAGGRSTIGTT